MHTILVWLLVLHRGLDLPFVIQPHLVSISFWSDILICVIHPLRSKRNNKIETYYIRTVHTKNIYMNKLTN